MAFSDSCDTFFDGYSRQVDGDKDDGLPPNGIFPNVADNQNDPYDGLPPETADSVQLGFSNSKSANLGDEDPANEPTPQFVSCSGTVKTFTTAPESPTGVEATSFSFSNVQTPAGNSFVVDEEFLAGGPLGTNKGFYVRIQPDGRYFDGSAYTTTKILWSRRTTVVAATCV